MAKDSKKTILVTGASSGFGKVIAEALAAQGHVVFGTSRHVGQQRATDSGAVRMLTLDVTQEESAKACINSVLNEAGRIDVLVNNAGNGICGAIEDTSMDEARSQMETNFWGTVRMTKLVLPVMRQQKHGRIITIGSMAGHISLPFQPFYSTSKFALEGFNEALRHELSGSGVDATIVCPGDFKTGFTTARRNALASGFGSYVERFNKTMAIYIRDEENGADPELVGKLIARLVELPTVDVRYFVGKFEQRAGVFIKRLMPARWFEKIIKSTYSL